MKHWHAWEEVCQFLTGFELSEDKKRVYCYRCARDILGPKSSVPENALLYMQFWSLEVLPPYSKS